LFRRPKLTLSCSAEGKEGTNLKDPSIDIMYKNGSLQWSELSVETVVTVYNCGISPLKFQ
jgi:hypothetical protein